MDFFVVLKCRKCYALTFYDSDKPDWEATPKDSTVRMNVKCPACDDMAVPYDITNNKTAFNIVMKEKLGRHKA